MNFSTRRSIPTVDRISDMPDSILCHILSFLPTKVSATTSVLSKRWKQVWLSVFTLYFNDKTFKDFDSFRKFVYLTMFSLRDKKSSIHSFTLICSDSSRFTQKQFHRIFKFVMQRGVENLNFNMTDKKCFIKLPPCILSFKTLHVLKLGNIAIKDFDHVDFPRVKTLHLDEVYFTSPQYFVKFLYGCPILEDLNTKSLIYNLPGSLDPIDNLNALPNLVKVSICYGMDNLMTLVCKAKILHLREMTLTRLPMFHNLTHMKLHFNHRPWERRGCRSILAILPHFPNLQHFTIKTGTDFKDICKGCWKLPLSVPECLSLQLKICCIKNYTGTEHEFEFAKYIMQNSEVLKIMKIQSTSLEKKQMLLKLSSCTKASTTCKLLCDGR